MANVFTFIMDNLNNNKKASTKTTKTKPSTLSSKITINKNTTAQSIRDNLNKSSVSNPLETSTPTTKSNYVKQNVVNVKTNKVADNLNKSSVSDPLSTSYQPTTTKKTDNNNTNTNANKKVNDNSVSNPLENSYSQQEYTISDEQAKKDRQQIVRTASNIFTKALNTANENSWNEQDQHKLDVMYNAKVDTTSVDDKIKADNTYYNNLVDSNGNFIDYDDQILELEEKKKNTFYTQEIKNYDEQIKLLKTYQQDIETLKRSANYNYLVENGASQDQLNEYKKYVIRDDYNGIERAIANFGSTIQGYVGNSLKGADTLMVLANQLVGNDDYESSEYADKIIEQAGSLQQQVFSNASSAEKVVYELYNSQANYLYALATAYMGGQLLSGMGSLLGATSTAQNLNSTALLLSDVSVLGSAMYNNEQMGYSKEDSLNNAILKACISHFTEKIGGDNIANIVTGKIGQKMLANGVEYMKKSIINSMISEGSEEFAEALLEPIADKLTTEKGMTVEDYLNRVCSTDTVYQVFMGAVGGGIAGGVFSANTLANFNRQVNAYASQLNIESKADYNTAKEALAKFNELIEEGEVEIDKVKAEGQDTTLDDMQLVNCVALSKAYSKAIADYEQRNPYRDLVNKESDKSKAEFSKDAMKEIINDTRPDLDNALGTIDKLNQEVKEQQLKASTLITEEAINEVANENTDITQENITSNENENIVNPSVEMAENGSNDILMDMQENTENVGYHYGAENLDFNRKSETISQKGSRGTGFFGTGTYFFGDKNEAKISGYDKKTEHKVDFSKYNLYKFNNYEDGKTFHDFFKEIENNYSKDAPKTIEEYNKGANELAEKLYEKAKQPIESDELKLSEMLYKASGYNGEAQKAHQQMLEAQAREETEISQIKEELSRYFDESEIDDMVEESTKDGKLDFNLLADRITDYTNDYGKSSIKAKKTSYVEEAINEKLPKVAKLLGISEEKLQNLINKYVDEVAEDYKNHNVRTDSLTTRIMKELGYEGIDVRGIKGLDNAMYGSVVYDLKPESVLDGTNNTETNNTQQTLNKEQQLDIIKNAKVRQPKTPYTKFVSIDNVDSIKTFEEAINEVANENTDITQENITPNENENIVNPSVENGVSQETLQETTPNGIVGQNEVPTTNETILNEQNIGNSQQAVNGVENVPSNNQDYLTNINENSNNENVADKIQSSYATVAPYYETGITDENYEEVYNAVNKTFRDNANEVAQALGINIKNVSENIGGFFNEDEGRAVRELSYTFELDGDFKQAQLFASILGDIGYENQKSVVASRYVDDIENANAVELALHFNNNEEVQNALDTLGIQDYTIDTKENVLKILEFDLNEEYIENRIKDIQEKLGGNYVSSEANPTYSELIERNDRPNLYKEWLGEGQNLEAQNENERNSESGNAKISNLINYANQRAIQAIETGNYSYTPQDATNSGVLNTNNDAETNTSQNYRGRRNYNRTNNPIDTEAQNRDGFFDYGTQPVRNVDISKETTYGKTSQSVRTMANSQYVDDATAQQMQEETLRGEYAYEQTTNKADTEEAIKTIKQLGKTKSIERILTDNDITHMNVNIAMAREMENQLLKEGDTETAFKIRKRLTHIAAMSGQNVQAYSTFKTLTPQDQILTIKDEVDRIQEGLNERYGDRAPKITLDEALIKEYLDSETEEKRNEVADRIAQSIADQIPPTIAERLNAWRHLSMLFNPRTWIKNSASNFAWGLVNGGKQGVQTIIESMLAKKFGDTKGERMAGFVNPLSQEYRTLKKTLDADYESNYKNFQGKYSKSDLVDVFGTGEFAEQVSRYRKSFKSDFLNGVENLNSKMMSDAPAMKSAYAYTIAGYLKTNNKTWESLTDTQRSNLREYAFNKAREITFNQDSELANAIGKLANTNMGTKLLVDSFIPFKRTPINILKQGVKYSPINLAKSISYNVYLLNKGKITGTQFADDLASGLTGTGIVLLGALLSNLGIFRTNDDDSKRKKYFDQGNGEQDFAIVTDKGTYTIDWLDPFVMPLSIGAELASNGGITSVEDIINIAAAIGDPIFETSMLSGITKNLQGYESGLAYAGGLLKNAISNYVSQYVPTVSGAVARTLDGTRRTTYPNEGFIDKTVKTTLSKIPGLSTLNEPYINKQGEEEKTEDLGMGVLGRAVLNFLSPGYYSSKEIDEYDEELYRLYDSTGNISVIPSNTTTSVDYDGSTYKLSDKEYTQWNKTRLSNETDYVNEFIDSKEYNNYDDSQKAKIIGKLRSYAGDVAKNELLENKGIEFDDTEYKNTTGALDSGLDLYQYFVSTDTYTNLKGDNKKSDYISYLNDLDTDSKGKNYLYDKYYGDSSITSNINDLGLNEDETYAAKIASNQQSLKDEDGNTIANSKAVAVAHAYEEAGVLDDVFAYIEKNGLEPKDFGLTKTVYGYSSEELENAYQSLYGENADLSSNKGKSSSGSKKTTTKSVTGSQISGSTSTTKSKTNYSTTNDFDNAYSAIMSSVKSGGKKNYGQSSSKSSGGSETTCPNCGSVVVPINGRCPRCGANL